MLQHQMFFNLQNIFNAAMSDVFPPTKPNDNAAISDVLPPIKHYDNAAISDVLPPIKH